jgi:hypothetical protein
MSGPQEEMGMDAQWWLDTTGKLAPTLVAAIVLGVTWAQNRWVNRVALRAAAVEDEKMRLTLLERRIEILDTFDDVSDAFWQKGHLDPLTLQRLQRALVAAELTFPAEKQNIAICRSHFMHMRDAIAGETRTSDFDRQAELREISASRLGNLQGALTRLRDQLVAAAIVEPVPPLTTANFRSSQNRERSTISASTD